MSNIVPFTRNNLPAVFSGFDVGSELSDNVGSSFAAVSIKGKTFRIRHSGTETPVTVFYEGNTFAAPYYDVVLVKGNSALSKTYYKDAYAEGSNEQPDCWSEDGVTPLAPVPVCNDCRLCPMNVFGSKVNQATGKGGKACQDTRKLAVVPAADLDNQQYGGAMLLRVPPASLKAVAEYEKSLRANGVPYCAVVTRLSFDASTAHPQLVLTPVRVLTEEEGTRIAAMRASLQVEDVLRGGTVSLPAPAQLPAGISAAAVPAGLQDPAPHATVPSAPSPTVAYAAPVHPAPAPQAYAQPAPQAPPQAYAQPVPAAPPAYAPPPAYVPPAAQATPAPAPQAPAPAPAAGVALDADFLSSIDNMLAS